MKTQKQKHANSSLAFAQYKTKCVHLYDVLA